MATNDDGWPLETDDVSEGGGWVTDNRRVGGGGGDSIDKFWVKRKMVYKK